MLALMLTMKFSVVLQVVCVEALASVSRAQTCTDFPDAFTVVIVGHTGFGKSTLIDMIAGGQEIAKTSGGMDAETETTSCYVMDYLNNFNPKIVSDKWRVVDTPGSADTGGMDVRNQKDMTATLRKLKKVDAIFLVWKIEERVTDELLQSVKLMRLAFGPKVWKKLVIVYTFLEWQQRSFWGSQSCKTIDDVKEYKHKPLVMRIFDYVKNTLKAPESFCVAVNDSDCFVDYNQLPFIGTSTTMDLLREAPLPNVGSYFNPMSQVWAHYGDCESDANQFQKLWTYAKKLTPRPLSTRTMVNMFVECVTALNDTMNVKAMMPPAKVSRNVVMKAAHTAASSMSSCWSGSIGYYSDLISSGLTGNENLQWSLAFALRDINHAKYVQVAKGFLKICQEDLDLFPDTTRFSQCSKHIVLTDQKECYAHLLDFYAANPTKNLKTKFDRHKLLRAFESNVLCSCDERDDRNNNHLSCEGYRGLEFNCPFGYTCYSRPFSATSFSTSQDKNFYLNHCRPAKTCDYTACAGTDYYLDKNRAGTLCDSSQECRFDECCSPRVTCDTFVCHGGLSNMGSNTLCNGGRHHCDTNTCCYCSGWNAATLFLSCYVGHMAGSEESDGKVTTMPFWRSIGQTMMGATILMMVVSAVLRLRRSRHHTVASAFANDHTEALLNN